jgi:TetR/AcrR family transcriptional repressor of nem operon
MLSKAVAVCQTIKKFFRYYSCLLNTDRYICAMFTPRSETTRQFIIETTAGIFNRKGYAGTSLSDLTEATRLTKGSIYGNFDNKEDVALAAFDYNVACRTGIIQDALRNYSSSRDKLLAFITIFGSAGSSAFPAGGCPLLNAGTEADDTHEPLRERVAEQLILWKEDLVGIIQQGIAANEFRADTNANKLALSIIALVEGGTLIGRSTRNPLYLDTILDTIRDLVKTIDVDG